MDIEQLTKAQTILLVLLVSFVTSLATGIVTVSLMEQGVSPVVNTVNKIVERTKEVVIKVPDKQKPVVVTEEKVIRINSDDLIAKAFRKAEPLFVPIYKKMQNTAQNSDNATSSDGTASQMADNSTTTATGTSLLAGAAASSGDDTGIATTTSNIEQLVFVARGILVNDSYIITAPSTIEPNSNYLVNINGENYKASSVGADDKLAVLKISDLSQEIAQLNYANLSKVKKGQVAIILSGQQRTRVIKSIISDILVNDSENISAIEFDLGKVAPGSLALDINGNILGIYTNSKDADRWFVSADYIKDYLNTVTNQEAKNAPGSN